MFTGNKKWFYEAKFGMMIHFGLYSILGGEWKGKRIEYIGEWAQSYFTIPNAEYHKLCNVFNPIYFNAEEWVKTALDAGMKYMVVTSKHHEGFALFHSKASKFNSVDATPFKRDVIGELAEACVKHNFKLGLYYSQALDWEQPNGGGWSGGHSNVGMSWTNDWDFPDNSTKDYSICFEGKIKPQVKEILTQYGDLCLIWFDTPFDITAEQSLELYDMVKKYQPECLINSRLGHGKCDYISAGDNQIIDDDKSKTGMLYEMPGTLNHTWGYKAFDTDWKKPERVLEIKRHLNERGINYLLNIGPDHLGRLPAPAIEILREVGRKNENI